MPWYRCLVRGENFPGPLTNRKKEVGFYTTRWVEAATPAQAETAVVELLQRDPKLRSAPTSANAKIYVEQIEHISRRHKAGTGFTFFSPQGDAEAAAAALDLERGANWPDASTSGR